MQHYQEAKGKGLRAAAKEVRLRKLGLNTRCIWECECRILVRRGRGAELGGRELTSPTPAGIAIDLFLSSNEII